jgi:hypothetical protein
MKIIHIRRDMLYITKTVGQLKRKSLEMHNKKIEFKTEKVGRLARETDLIAKTPK